MTIPKANNDSRSQFPLSPCPAQQKMCRWHGNFCRSSMRVLIADDQRSVGASLGDLVNLCKHEVVEVVGSGLEAIHAYGRHKPDVVLMDYVMAKLNGATACRNILAKDPDARIILVSGMPKVAELADSGAIGVLAKPVSSATSRAHSRQTPGGPGTSGHRLRRHRGLTSGRGPIRLVINLPHGRLLLQRRCCPIANRAQPLVTSQKPVLDCRRILLPSGRSRPWPGRFQSDSRTSDPYP